MKKSRFTEQPLERVLYTRLGALVVKNHQKSFFRQRVSAFYAEPFSNFFRFEESPLLAPAIVAATSIDPERLPVKGRRLSSIDTESYFRGSDENDGKNAGRRKNFYL